MISTSRTSDSVTAELTWPCCATRASNNVSGASVALQNPAPSRAKFRRMSVDAAGGQAVAYCVHHVVLGRETGSRY